MTETWKKITGFENYEVSNLGNLRKGIKKINPCVTKKGYVRFSVTKDGKLKSLRLNRIVLIEFIGQPPQPKMEAAHLNGIRNDNRLENLTWATAQENADHRKIHKTNRAGDTHPMRKLCMDDVRAIRKLAKWNDKKTRVLNVKEAAKLFNVSRSTICNIVNNKYWVDSDQKAKGAANG